MFEFERAEAMDEVTGEGTAHITYIQHEFDAIHLKFYCYYEILQNMRAPKHTEHTMLM